MLLEVKDFIEISNVSPVPRTVPGKSRHKSACWVEKVRKIWKHNLGRSMYSVFCKCCWKHTLPVFPARPSARACCIAMDLVSLQIPLTPTDSFVFYFTLILKQLWKFLWAQFFLHFSSIPDSFQSMLAFLKTQDILALCSPAPSLTHGKVFNFSCVSSTYTISLHKESLSVISSSTWCCCLQT